MSSEDPGWDLLQARIAADNAARNATSSREKPSERTNAGSEKDRKKSTEAGRIRGSEKGRIKGDTKSLYQRNPSKYPWDVWMDAGEHLAVSGKDYEGPASKFQIVLHNTARRHGVYVATEKTMTEQEEEAVRFQFCISSDASFHVKQEWRREKVREWFEVDE